MKKFVLAITLGFYFLVFNPTDRSFSGAGPFEDPAACEAARTFTASLKVAGIAAFSVSPACYIMPHD